ncbi:5883_t:CDS:2, partial [Paraglomus occultum]
DICVNVNDNVWITNKEEMDYTTLPQLIAPQTSLEFDCKQPLSFFLRKHKVDQPGPPLRATDLLRLTATMTGLRKTFPAFDIEGRVINIQYPIEFTHISHLNSMVVGQTAKVKWGVQNTSNVDFGALAPNGRRIRVRLEKKAGEVSRSALKFGLKTEQQGVATVPPVQTLEREYIFEIPLLRAGQTLQLEASLELSEAEIFEYAEFWIYLELGQITAPSLPNVVHIQSFNVRVSTIYRGFPAGFYPDVLLVTNHKTARDEYMAWADLLKQQLGLRFFVWDISQMGHFGFTRPIPTLFSSEPTTLMKDLAGKTMIILDNEFEYGDYARTVTALSFVMKCEWLQAMHENDNKFVFNCFIEIASPFFFVSLRKSSLPDRFYVVCAKADRNARLVALEEFARTPFEAWKQTKYSFEHVQNLTHHLMAITDDSSKQTNMSQAVTAYRHEI